MRTKLLHKIYLNISIKTLEYLLKEKVFTKEHFDKYHDIYLIITDSSININKIIKDLERYEFGVILNFNAFDSINLNTFINNKLIKGIYTNVDLKDKYELINVFKVLNYEIISEKAIFEYYYLKLISNNLFKFKDLFVK